MIYGPMRVMTWRKVRISSHRLESADWPHSRSLQKKRPVGQTASFQPTQHLFKSPHSSRCRPAAAAPTVFTRRRQSRTICRCAPGAFGRADVAIYIYHYIQTRCGDKVRPAAEGGADVTEALSHQRYTDLSSSFQKYTGGEVGTYVAVCQRGQF